MKSHEIHVAANSEELFQQTAERVTSALASALIQRKQVSFVLTGGNTPSRLYELIAASPFRERIDWSRVEFFWGDERTVPPDHPESNYGMAWRTMLSRLPIHQSQIHRILGELEDHEKAARRYEAEIRRVTQEPGTPALDVVLLGMGDDGHTASLFRDTCWDEERLIVANYVAKLKTTRITMTPKLLNVSCAIFFLVSGLAKAAAIRRVLGNHDPDLPASRIRPTQGLIVWLLDRDAASQLPERTALNSG